MDWHNTWEGENLNRQFEILYGCKLCENTIFIKGALSGVSRTSFFKYELKYTVNENGEIKTELSGKVKENCIWLPRLGFELKLPYEKSEFEYYGMGPFESYCDMYRASMIRLYKSDADSEYMPYIMPQEHGNHSRTSYLKINDGLCFEAEKDFDINVSHYSKKTLEKAMHWDELKKDNVTTVRIEYKNSGVGSNSCGPYLLEKYRLSEKEINFLFYIK